MESPLRPDGAKFLSKTLYDDVNGLKEVVSFNLLDRVDRTEFNKLVKVADGLIEGFRPNAKLKLGLDAPSLHSVNPNLCIASVVGFPEDGPRRDHAGHDMNFAAATGLASLSNEMPAMPLADLFTAYEGALSLATAMDGVSRGVSSGTRVVISMSEAIKEAQSVIISEYKATKDLPSYGNTLFTGKFPCYRMYTAKCGRRVTVGAIEKKFWLQVCEILGVPHLTGSAYATGEEGAKVKVEVQAAMEKRTWVEWEPLFYAADCCVEPVRDFSELY